MTLRDSPDTGPRRVWHPPRAEARGVLLDSP